MTSFNKEYNTVVSQISEFEEKRECLIKTLQKAADENNLVAYGASGGLGHLNSDCPYLSISAVCDSFKSGISEITSTEIISPEILKKRYADAVVIVTGLTYYKAITESLLNLGITSDKIIPYSVIYKPMLRNVFETNYIAGFEWMFENVHDASSRQTIVDKMRWHLLGDLPRNKSNSKQYFEKEILPWEDARIFVDGGAFSGENSIEFLNQTKTKEVNVFAFEPNHHNYRRCLDNLSNHPNVNVEPIGLWNCPTELEFFPSNQYGDSTFVHDMVGADYSKKTIVKVTSLDYYFLEKNCNATPAFIKADIEGAEREMLLGAKRILESKPLLAISAYHKPEDIYELAQTIISIKKDYSFSLRHYGDHFYESVLYAY